MPMVNRAQVDPVDALEIVSQLATWPEQRAYEQLRPVVLFGQPVAARARETAAAERTHQSRDALRQIS